MSVSFNDRIIPLIVVGSLYPLLRIEVLIEHAKHLYRYPGAGVRNGLTPESRSEGVIETKTYLLKMALACALMVEGCGESSIGEQLFESVRSYTDAIMHSEAVNFENLPLMALVVS